MDFATRWLSVAIVFVFSVIPVTHAQVKPGDPVDYAVDAVGDYINALRHDDITAATKLMAPGTDSDLVEIYLRGQASLFAQGHSASVVDGWEDGKCAAVIIKRTPATGSAEYDVVCLIYVDDRWKVLTEIEDLPTPLSAEQHQSLEKLKTFAKSQIPENG